jgi:hypothetical protein
MILFILAVLAVDLVYGVFVLSLFRAYPRAKVETCPMKTSPPLARHAKR